MTITLPNDNSQPDLLSPEWQAVLRQTEREVVETLDLDQVLAYVLDIAVRATQADDAAIAIADGDGRYTIAQVVGAHYRSGEPGALFGMGIFHKALHERVSIFTPDVSADPHYFPVCPNTCAQMTLIIEWRDELIGALVLETERCDRFSETTWRFMLSYMDRVALAIDNARAHEQLRRQVRELAAVTERLRAAELLKSMLLDVAAHDLRGPINGIHSLMTILLTDQTLTPDRQRAMLQAMMGSAGEAQRIIEELLMLRRVERGTAQTYRPLDLTTMLKGIIDHKRPGVQLHKQVLVVDMPPESVLVLGDPMLMRESLSNLLDNAIKYTPDNGHITVIVTVIDDHVRVQVIDTGYGIKAEDLPRIFDPFFRSQESVERGILGTGLGLHLVRQIVEQHGGTITVSSRVDIGSEFTLNIPLLPKSG